jgi:hypothetical protein
MLSKGKDFIASCQLVQRKRNITQVIIDEAMVSIVKIWYQLILQPLSTTLHKITCMIVND